MSAQRQGPLSRYMVIDLTRARAGPTAARHFADWGADVIKIEMPAEQGEDDSLGGSRDGPDFFNLHRNKRSLTLNLKSPEGVAVLKKLAAKADVLIENYRPDVKNRLGIDYETLKAINPRLVYVSLSGFGQDGPYANRPGFDQIAQGMGGLMSITGLPGQGPVRVGIPDRRPLHRQLRGHGRAGGADRAGDVGAGAVGHDLAAAVADLHAGFPGGALDRGARGAGPGRQRPSDLHPDRRVPDGGRAYQHRGIGRPHLQAHVRGAGCAEPASDPDFSSGEKRSANRVRLNAEIGQRTKRYKSDELVGLLNKAGVPSGPIYSIDQMWADKQVQHVGMAVPMEHPTKKDVAIVNQAVALSRTPSVINRPTPKLGEHNDEVLAELGYDKDAIADMTRRKVI